jgi:glutamate transport system permease protein
VTAAVLFDAPGPRTRARHRAYTVASLVGLAGLLAFVVYRLNAEGQLEYELWEPFVTPRYVRALLVDGLLTTLSMAASAVVLSVLMGVALGVGKLSDHDWVQWPCWAVVEFFRAVPVLLLMIFIFFSWGISRDATGAYWTVVIALMFYNGAVLAEIFRAGVLAVPRGQSEAAYAVGMGKTQVMNHIMLPQAVKIMLPAIISQCVVVLKDTSLGYAVAAPGLTKVGRDFYLNFQNHVPVILVVALVYIAVNMVLTWLATWVQRRFVGERKPLVVSQVAAAGTQDDPLL